METINKLKANDSSAKFCYDGRDGTLCPVAVTVKDYEGTGRAEARMFL